MTSRETLKWEGPDKQEQEVKNQGHFGRGRRVCGLITDTSAHTPESGHKAIIYYLGDAEQATVCLSYLICKM
jgi:hypothetical protein